MSVFDIKRRLAYGRVVARCTMTNAIYRLHPDTNDVYFCSFSAVVNHGPLPDFIQRVEAGLTRATLEATNHDWLPTRPTQGKKTDNQGN